MSMLLGAATIRMGAFPLATPTPPGPTDAQPTGPGAVQVALQTTASGPGQVAVPANPALPDVAATEKVAQETASETNPAQAPNTDKPAGGTAGADSEVVRALKGLTVDSKGPLPEAARPDSAVSGALIAGKLAVGQKSQSVEVLPQTGKPVNAKLPDPVTPAKSVAAQVTPAGANTAQGKTSPAAPAAAQPNVSGQIDASTSSGAGLHDSWQFTDEKPHQSAAVDIKAGDTPDFGAALASRIDAGQVKPDAHPVDSGDTAAARVSDPAIGESVVQQIVGQVVLHKAGDTSTLTVHLNPPELGTIKLNVTSESGVLTTEIQSQNASVRNLLEVHIPALRDALSNAGIEVSTFNVSAGSDFGQLSQGRQQTWQPAQPHPALSFAQGSQDQSNSETAPRSDQTLAAGYDWLA